MLTLYRRHKKNCEHQGEGRTYRRCHCPIWVDGFLSGVEVRQSLKLIDWQRAHKLIQEWEARGAIEVQAAKAPITITAAKDGFLADLKARNLRESTRYKYGILLKQLETFGALSGLRYLKECDTEALRKFRASWTNRNLSALKKLEALKTFGKFAVQSGWIAENYAARLERPKVSMQPTMPFTREEMERILKAADSYGAADGYRGRENGRRMRAFVLALRYTGMRIGDVVTLERHRVKSAKLFLYTAKTGTPVYCPLPELVVQALGVAPRSNERYFFWTGQSKVKSAVGDWQRGLKKLFKAAEVEGGHAHRFRDTFAVELLLAGVPIERVSMLLGHSSVRVTEKHYTPWVKSRQEQLESDVRKSWATDPVIPAETKGTPEVRVTVGRYN